MLWLNKFWGQGLSPFFLLLLVGVALCGCTKKTPPRQTLTEIQERFEKKCLEDFGMHVMTRMVGGTFWIYFPTQDPIFDYEAQRENSVEAKKKPSRFAVLYADAQYTDRRFVLDYDIVTRTKIKSEDTGFNSSYTDTYSKQQNNLFTAISDVFFDIQDPAMTPKFIVVIITDIKKGIETKITFYLQDFKRFMGQDMPNEEFLKRYLADTNGGQSLIGDETGSHIQYSDVQMPDFLARQMVNRINFKFQRSDFPPEDNYDNAIIDIVADTLRFYTFEDFSSVQLRSLRQDKGPNRVSRILLEKNQLAGFGEDPSEKLPENQKLIHIRFDNGEVSITGAEDETKNAVK